MEARPLNRVVKGWDTLRLPRLGAIQIGEKDEKGRPRSLDYFVCPPEVREVYGEQPRRLDIAFPVEDISMIFPSQLERYGDQFGRICTGDGERANLSAVYARGKTGQAEYGLAVSGGKFVSTATGDVLPLFKGQGGKEYVQMPCAHRACPLYRQLKCREIGRLKFLLPKVPGVLGVYQIATSSVNSYLNVAGALALLLKMLETLRQPVWTVTLQLEVRMEPAHPLIGEGDAQRQIKTTVPALYILKNDMTLEEFVRRATAGALAERQAVSLPPGVKVEIEEDSEDEKPDLLFSNAEAGLGEDAGNGAEGASEPEAAREDGGDGETPSASEPAGDSKPVGEKKRPTVYGEFEVTSQPTLRKDPRTGGDVAVVQVKVVEADEDEVQIPAGRTFWAFSAPGAHDLVRDALNTARPGSRLRLGSYKAREDALVVDQAIPA